MTFKLLKWQIAENLNFQIFRFSAILFSRYFVELISKKHLHRKLPNRYDKKKQKGNRKIEKTCGI